LDDLGGGLCLRRRRSPQRARPLGFRKRGGRPTKRSVTAARDTTICAHTSSSVWRARCDCAQQRRVRYLAASVPTIPKSSVCGGFCAWTGEHVVIRKAIRLHCQPDPSLASETPCGSPAATAAPAANMAATASENNRSLFQGGFMTGPFQLDPDILTRFQLTPYSASNARKTGVEGEKAGGRYAADLVLATAGLALTGSAAFRPDR
jgi:hypothetical protein